MASVTFKGNVSPRVGSGPYARKKDSIMTTTRDGGTIWWRSGDAGRYLRLQLYVALYSGRRLLNLALTLTSVLQPTRARISSTTPFQHRKNGHVSPSRRFLCFVSYTETDQSLSSPQIVSCVSTLFPVAKGLRRTTLTLLLSLLLQLQLCRHGR